MRYTPLRDQVQILIDHLSDAERKPSPALVKRTADQLSTMLLESTPLLHVLRHPEDLELRKNALSHLHELEKIIERKCTREVHASTSVELDH